MKKKYYRVMVVDDDDSVRKSLCKLLDSEGYQVLSATNGGEAIEIFQREESQVDLLLIDLIMPVKNGWAALDHLQKYHPLLTVFVLTGLPHQVELAKVAGVNALVEKPINVTELLRIINRQFSQSGQSLVQGPEQGRSAFRHLRATDYSSRALQTELAFSDLTYAHWGLNE